MNRVSQVILVLVLVLLGIGTAAAQGNPSYLGVGDSIPFGFNPTIPLTAPFTNLLSNYHGYPQYVSGLLNLSLTNASCPGQTSSSFIDVGAPEPHLGVVGEVGVGTAVDQQRGPFARVEQEMVRDRLGRQRHSDLVLVEALAGFEVGGDEHRGDAIAVQHRLCRPFMASTRRAQ